MAFYALRQPMLATTEANLSSPALVFPGKDMGSFHLVSTSLRTVLPVRCKIENTGPQNSTKKNDRFFAFFGGTLAKSWLLRFPRSRSTKQKYEGKDGLFQPHLFNGLQLRRARGSGASKSHSILSEESDYIETQDTKAQAYLSMHNSKSSSGSFTKDVSPLAACNPPDNLGKSGLITFYGYGSQQSQQLLTDLESPKKSWWSDVLWFIGPTALVCSVILPPLYLKKVFEIVLEDSLVTDFLILFFTEALFYVGVSIFLFVAHKVHKSAKVVTWKDTTNSNLSYKISSVATMVLGILLPIGTFAIVWPWTGPAAVAALVPYIAGLLVQFCFEQFVCDRKSPVWPLIPVVFQVYRLHQLNRAAQLVVGLLFSLRGSEATAETLAVNGSLQTLLSVLQLLGMLCLWSLAAYLTYVFLFGLQRAPIQTSRVPSTAETQ